MPFVDLSRERSKEYAKVKKDPVQMACLEAEVKENNAKVTTVEQKEAERQTLLKKLRNVVGN